MMTESNTNFSSSGMACRICGSAASLFDNIGPICAGCMSILHNPVVPDYIPAPIPPKPIQIAIDGTNLVALCSDGSFWLYHEKNCVVEGEEKWGWEQLPSIPFEVRK